MDQTSWRKSLHKKVTSLQRMSSTLERKVWCILIRSTLKPTRQTPSMDGSNIGEEVFVWKSHPLIKNIIYLRKRYKAHIWGPTLKPTRQTPSMDESNIVEDVFVQKSDSLAKNVIHLERKGMKYLLWGPTLKSMKQNLPWIDKTSLRNSLCEKASLLWKILFTSKRKV